MNYQVVTLAALSLPAIPLMAQQDASPPTQVIVSGTQGDTDTGRDFLAGKKIISRKRIDDSGLSTVEAILKRDPAVSISADGRIGLLGLPGYTQILVDGAAPTGSKSLQLELVHVEQIEIVKSTEAQYGPYGIAGTINIVRRKTMRKTDTALTLKGSNSNGQSGVNFSVSHHQNKDGSPLRFSGQVSGGVTNARETGTLRQTTTVNDQDEQTVYDARTIASEHGRNVDASGEVQWQLSPSSKISVAPGIGRFESTGRVDEARRWVEASVLDSRSVTRATTTMLMLPLKWQIKPRAGSSFDVDLRTTVMRLDTDIARLDASGVQSDVARSRLENRDFSGKVLSLAYKTRIAKAHAFKTGLSYRRDDERSHYDYQRDGQQDASLAYLGPARRATKQQGRVFAQDEWTISDSTAMSLGLSGEDTAFDVTEADFHARPHYRLWSPSLNLSHKIGGNDARQVRASVARTFRAPGSTDFSLRPLINPLAPCVAPGSCTANTIDTADTAGNPQLQPERALGINLSYEHGIAADSQLTVELFTRLIDRKIGANIALEQAPWSALPRYVSRPVNLGSARVRGINLETELALRDLFDKDAPQLSLRGSVNWTHSTISTLPGPDNRLDGQTPWRAKFGLTHVLTGLPLKVDLDANWTAPVWVRANLSERLHVPRSFNLDAGATWSLRSGQKLLVNIQNLAPQTQNRISEFAAPEEIVRLYTRTKNYTALSVRFETKL